MLQSEQIPLEEWFSLAKSLFWHETNFERFCLKVWISEMYLEPTEKSLTKLFPENS